MKDFFSETCEHTGVTVEDRDGWLKARKGGIGGSDVAAVLGLSPYKSALELYADKLSVLPASSEEAEYLQWGRLFEPVILAEYARRTGRAVFAGGEILRSRAHPFLLVTLDGVQIDDRHAWGAGPGTVEVKTALQLTTTPGDRSYEKEIPVAVQLQKQHELLVTGANWGTVVWLPFPERRLQWRDCPIHQGSRDAIIEACAEFWHMVEHRSPPPPDGTKSSKRALEALFPGCEEASVLLKDGGTHADLHEHLSDQIKRLTALKDQLTNRVLATMRTSKYLLTGDGRYWSRSLIGPASIAYEREAYTSVTLRPPRKKMFPMPHATLELVGDTGDDLAPLLAASLGGGLTKEEA